MRTSPEYFLLRPEVEKAYGYTHAVKIGDDIKISVAVSMDALRDSQKPSTPCFGLTNPIERTDRGKFGWSGPTVSTDANVGLTYYIWSRAILS